jgi:hypothetical protein
MENWLKEMPDKKPPKTVERIFDRLPIRGNGQSFNVLVKEKIRGLQE